MSEFEDFIKELLRNRLDARLAEQPWWCMICGMGGNYEGERPDQYWFPPKDHICKHKEIDRR